MCVIFVVDGEEIDRPTDEEIGAAFDANDDGGGVAWREEVNGEIVVQWKKNLAKDEMIELLKIIPLPYIAHFRIASCGGIRPELCHPFPLEDGIPLDLEGYTRNGVIAHNGHWNTWETELRRASYESRIKLSHGPWMDSRALAYILHHFGPGHLDFINAKVAVLKPEGGIELFGSFGGGDWAYHQKRFLASNLYWTAKLEKNKSPYLTPPASMVPAKPTEQAGGAAQGTTFRTESERTGDGGQAGDHSVEGSRVVLQGGTNLKEQIQEAEEAIRATNRQMVAGRDEEGEGSGSSENDARGRRASRGRTRPDHSLEDGDDEAVELILAPSEEELSKWCQKLCAEKNPKRFKAGENIDPEREVRKTRLQQGITTLGRL